MPSPNAKDHPLRVAVIADSAAAANEVTRALRGSGYSVRPFSLSVRSAYDRVRELRPSVVVLRSGPRSFSLAFSFARASANGGPALVLLTPTGSRQAIKLALDAGALVHLVEPVPAQAVAAAVSVAAARGRDMRDLERQLTEVRESIEARKIVERAKKVLIRRFRLTEEEAHRRLQRESRNRNRKLIDTACHVIRADAALSASRRRPASQVESPTSH